MKLGPVTKLSVKLTFSLIVTLKSYKNWKQNQKMSNTALTLLLWVSYCFFLQKNADVGKIKRALLLKFIFSKTLYVCVIQVSSIILTSFRRRGAGRVNLKFVLNLLKSPLFQVILHVWHIPWHIPCMRDIEYSSCWTFTCLFSIATGKIFFRFLVKSFIWL